MQKKVYIYGDSFSAPGNCLAETKQMWYGHVFDGHDIMVNAREGNCVSNMFLEAAHDCITLKESSILVVALGPLQRLPMYTDGWHDLERLTDIDTETAAERINMPPRSTNLRDCLRYMDSFHVYDIGDTKTKKLIDCFHPTLLWSLLYKEVINLHSHATQRGHRVLVLHMHHVVKEHSQQHPLVRPLEQEVLEKCNYIGAEDSCHTVCKHAGILPWDFDKHGHSGHHSVAGQLHFGKHIKQLIERGKYDIR